MLKLAQLASRVQASEQPCSEDDDIVAFAVSREHISGPFSFLIDFLNDATTTESFADVKISMTPISSSSSSCSITGSFTLFIFILSLGR